MNSEEPTSSLPSSKPEVEIRPKMTLGGGGGNANQTKKPPSFVYKGHCGEVYMLKSR